MIRIIGIIHVIDITSKVYAAIDYYAPSAVGIELDGKRLDSLIRGEYENRLSIAGILSSLQRRIAMSSNIIPGGEMLAAYRKATMNQIPVVLIDDDIEEIYVKIKGIPVKEKVRIIIDTLFSLPFSRRFTIDELLDNEDLMIEKFRKRYPMLHEYLLVERNRNMASRIIDMEKKYGNVLIFSGDAHLPGLGELIPDAEIIRLREFLKMNIPNNTFNFSIRIS
ncbi:MAG: TraB/GumN family protein [Thermoplasmata archaeon]|jgi:pheromone shutdown protein TraB|nr:hypothetical protein [Thermoplasmatales archaeon]PMP74316.1 MAG: hypothetical protein C0180_04395 [Aciduliprofundum sp.]